VASAGSEHSKPLEKSEGLFAQDRDPRFPEIYPSITAGMGFFRRLLLQAEFHYY
jgi:hypothetical protein